MTYVLGFSLTSLALGYVATVGVHAMASGTSTMDELWMALLDSDDDSDVEDLILLPELEKRSRECAARAERRARHGKRMDFESLTPEQCKSWFRFEKVYIPGLVTALGLPEELVASNRTRCTGLEGLCILLRRLAYPNRLEDLEGIFGRGVSELSVITNLVLDFLYEKWHHLLDTLPAAWLTDARLEEGAEAVLRHCPLPQVWGFIDGTVRLIPRPIQDQRLFYNSHKHVHALKFQTVMSPFGIMVHLFGPVEGCRHDAAILQESGLLLQTEQHMTRGQGSCWVLYGDPAYPIRPQIVRPFQGACLSPEQSAFNSQMSTVHVCVEWGFGAITRLWAFVDFKKNTKILLQPVAKYYVVAALLTNCHACVYGNNICEHFQLHPPTLTEYLQ